MKTIRIGRSHSNDCVFENQSVSGSHAVLMVEPGEQYALLRDLGSTNGTYINGSKNRITGEVRISTSDSIRFGNEITTLSAILEKANKTVIKNVGGTGVMPGVASRTIGKSPENQIVINRDGVSRRHAILYKNNDGSVVIEDQNSTNGTYVNGVKVMSKVLQPGDKITIARIYPLEWESVFGPAVTPNKKKDTGGFRLMPGVAAAVAVLLIVCGAGWYFWQNRSWDKEKIYKEYHSAVCWIYTQYGYRILLNDRDFTSLFCQYYKIPEAPLVHINDGKISSGPAASEGTGFFVSTDGKLGTNLHVAQPWTYTNDTKVLEAAAKKILSELVTEIPEVALGSIEVENVLQAIYILPDGLPISSDNLVECEVLKIPSDTNKDVAVLQTKTRALPQQVVRIVDPKQADTSDDACTEGRMLFTIGFPYGNTLGMNSRQEMKNQVHDGSVTQDRGEYEFGHDAETAGGASGSPIFNEHGQLIGVHHAGMTGATGAQGFNMAIKAKYLLELLN